nr:hypothetical protein GCM10020185_49910 [Pseudomonas brassicacearum subsp. brassicacearum]
MKDFIGGDNKMAEWVVRQHGIPQAIFVDDGYMNLKDLAKKLPKYIIETSPGVYLAKIPIVVGQKGILEIDKQTQELRLSQEGGAFLVNDGHMFIRDTKVTGWREKGKTALRPSVHPRNSVRSCWPGVAPRPTSSTPRWPVSATPTVSRTG